MSTRPFNARQFSLHVVAITAILFGVIHASHAGAILYGVSGDGADPAEVFYEVNTTDASTSFIQNLGNGDDGESIAFRGSDGLMYHWSGLPNPQNQVMETINLLTGELHPVLRDFSAYDPTEVFGSTYDAAGDRFLYTDINGNLGAVTPDGAFSLIGRLTEDAELYRGIAFNAGALYVGERGAGNLFQVDPSSAAKMGDATVVTLPNFTVTGINALTTDLGTGDLYAILKVSGGGRHLVTIDPVTGRATDVGRVRSGLANIEFGAAAVFVPEPTTFALFAVGLLGLARTRTRQNR